MSLRAGIFGAMTIRGERSRTHLSWWAGPLIVVVAVAIWWRLIGDGLSAVTGSDYTRGLHIARAVAATAFTLPLLYIVRRHVDRRPWSWSDFGLAPLRTGWRPFLFGVACWTVPAGITTAVVLSLGWAHITVRGPLPGLIGTISLLTALVLLFEPIPEELAYRGYLLSALGERYSTWVAVVGQAVLFTLWGTVLLGWVDPDRVVLLFTFGTLLGALRVTTGSLWPCLGFHTAFQVGAQYLGGQRWGHTTVDDPDSALIGLAFVLVPFVSTAVLLWMIRRRRTRGSVPYPHPPGRPSPGAGPLP